MLLLVKSASATALSLLTPPATLLLASSGSVDPTAALTVYGPIGIVCVLLMLGWLVPKYAYDAVVADRDRQRTLAESSVPLVARNSEVTAEAIALIHMLQDKLDRDRDRPPPRRRSE